MPTTPCVVRPAAGARRCGAGALGAPSGTMGAMVTDEAAVAGATDGATAAPPPRLAIVGYGGAGREIHARLAAEAGLPPRP